VYVCVRAHVLMCVCYCVCVCARTNTYVCVHVRMHVCMYVCMRACMCVSVHTHVCVCCVLLCFIIRMSSSVKLKFCIALSRLHGCNSVSYAKYDYIEAEWTCGLIICCVYTCLREWLLGFHEVKGRRGLTLSVMAVLVCFFVLFLVVRTCHCTVIREVYSIMCSEQVFCRLVVVFTKRLMGHVNIVVKLILTPDGFDTFTSPMKPRRHIFFHKKLFNCASLTACTVQWSKV